MKPVSDLAPPAICAPDPWIAHQGPEIAEGRMGPSGVDSTGGTRRPCWGFLAHAAGNPSDRWVRAPGKGADHPRFSGAEGEAARPLSRGRQPTTESGESAAESSAVTLKAWTTRVGGGRSSSTTSGIPPASSAGRHRRQPLGERPVVARARARPVGNLVGGRRARPRQLGRADFTSAPTRSLLGWVVGSESRSRVIASSETRCGTRYERRPESRTFR
jgi:hypothetical protein